MAARLLRRVVRGERRGENGWIKNLLRKARNYPGRRAPEGRVHSFFADNVAVGSGHFLHPLAEVAVEGGRPCTPLYIWLSLEGEGAGVIKLGRKLAAALAKLLSLAASIQPLHGLVSTIRSERFDGFFVVTRDRLFFFSPLSSYVEIKRNFEIAYRYNFVRWRAIFGGKNYLKQRNRLSFQCFVRWDGRCKYNSEFVQ